VRRLLDERACDATLGGRRPCLNQSLSKTASPAPTADDWGAAPEASRLAAWFEAHGSAVWRLAARLGVPPGSVDDVVQEVFMTAHRRADAIRPGCERQYLLGVAVRISANARRRRRSEQSLAGRFEQHYESLTAPAPGAEQLLAERQLRTLLDQVLAELPEPQRVVLVLHELEAMTVSAIAELLELAPGTVASRLSRARARFSRVAERARARWESEGTP
jgi:RNA polymerase sigma-70 factor, ECF subfamily